ncbi:MAG: hypothetical protein LBT14_09450 [Treponema sp.]|jgi:hypothetical protein|nr:hypothetical protein [Treponema sp.]
MCLTITDFDSHIAQAAADINNRVKPDTSKPAENADVANTYVKRAFVRCLSGEVPNFDEAIKDCSMSLQFAIDNSNEKIHA